MIIVYVLLDMTDQKMVSNSGYYSFLDYWKSWFQSVARALLIKI